MGTILATLTLTLSFLTSETTIDKHGKATTHEVIAYTTSVLPYESMGACNNAKEEYNFAFGAYQMSKRPTRVITAICNDVKTGTVQ
jgi:hypothetical protein